MKVTAQLDFRAFLTSGVMDKQTMIQLSLDALNHGNFLQVNKKLIRKIGLINACVLSNFVDKYKYHKDYTNDFEGWFHYSYGWQTNSLNLKRNTLQEAINSLLELNLITRKKMGMPAKFYYQLNFESIVKLVYTPESKESSTQGSLSRRKVRLKSPKKVRLSKSSRRTTTPGVEGGQKIPTNNKGYNNKPKNKKIIEKNKKVILPNGPTKKEEQEVLIEPYIELAKRLSSVIQKTKNIDHTKPQLKAWAVEIKKLNTKNNIPYSRINDALEWYENNVGGEFVPVIESGTSLRNKFIKLENAIDRESKPSPGAKSSKLRFGTGRTSGINFNKNLIVVK